MAKEKKKRKEEEAEAYKKQGSRRKRGRGGGNDKNLHAIVKHKKKDLNENLGFKKSDYCYCKTVSQPLNTLILKGL